jgi:hypothetical protein
MKNSIRPRITVGGFITLSVLLMVASLSALQAKAQVFPSDSSITFFSLGEETNIKRGFTPPTTPQETLIGAYFQNKNPNNRFTVASYKIPFIASVEKTFSPFSSLVAFTVPNVAEQTSMVYIIAVNWGSTQVALTLSEGTPSNNLIVFKTTLPEYLALQAVEANPTTPFRFITTGNTMTKVTINLFTDVVGDQLRQFLPFNVQNALGVSGLCFEDTNCQQNVHDYMKTRQ